VRSNTQRIGTGYDRRAMFTANERGRLLTVVGAMAMACGATMMAPRPTRAVVARAEAPPQSASTPEPSVATCRWEPPLDALILLPVGQLPTSCPSDLMNRPIAADVSLCDPLPSGEGAPVWLAFQAESWRLRERAEAPSLEYLSRLADSYADAEESLGSVTPWSPSIALHWVWSEIEGQEALRAQVALVAAARPGVAASCRSDLRAYRERRTRRMRLRLEDLLGRIATERTRIAGLAMRYRSDAVAFAEMTNREARLAEEHRLALLRLGRFEQVVEAPIGAARVLAGGLMRTAGRGVPPDRRRPPLTDLALAMRPFVETLWPGPRRPTTPSRDRSLGYRVLAACARPRHAWTAVTSRPESDAPHREAAAENPDVIELPAYLSRAQVLRGLEPLEPDFQQCSGLPLSRLRIDLTIMESGFAIGRVGGELGGTSAAACIEQALRGPLFPRSCTRIQYFSLPFGTTEPM